MKKITLFFAVLLSLLGVTQVNADELTVYDGTNTNEYVPLYGYYADTQGGISEFIIPSSQLTALSGKEIEQMVFYLSSPASKTFGAASFNVYLEEVAGSNYDDSSASLLTDSKTLVYAGALDATGNTMEIPFTTNYTYNGGNLLVAIEVGTKGTYTSATFYGTTTTNNTGRYKYGSSSSGSGRVKFIPKTTFITPTVGPGLTVKDGSIKLSSPYTHNFGLSTAGTVKTFTLSNPGTEDLDVSVTETGNFGAGLSATTIAAGGEVTLTLTMPEATGSSVVTITPEAGSGIDPFIINVSGTVRDASKVYLDFADGTIPDGWTSVAIGTYASQYGTAWTAYEGYVSQSGSSSSYEWAFTSPKLNFTEGETVFFETSKYGSSSWYNSSIKVEYSVDGTTWTTIGSAFTDDVYGTWTPRSVAVPTADAKYIRFSGWYVNLRNIYGGELPNEPKMVVTQPASLNYGIIAEATDKTFTIANTGLAALEGISVTSSNAAFTITNAPASLAAGTSQDVTITMTAATAGAQSSDITVSATGMDDVQFTVSGVVMPDGMPVEDFADGLPANWTNTTWVFNNGVATGKSYSAYLTTPKLVFADGDFIIIKAKRNDSDATDYITVQGSNDNGETWTAYNKKITGADGLTYPDYATLVLTDIPSTVNKLRFVGYFVDVDEIAGLQYAPILKVTDGDAAEVASGLTYDFGEIATATDVTYTFANAGSGNISVTNVAITGDGAAAYSTNWTESVDVPFGLTISRNYDAERTGVQAAVVTVTTTEGDFVINVTGSDKAANAPELAVSTDAIDFGKVTADAVETVTVTNQGTGLLSVSIASDSEEFVVSAAELTEIAAGESKQFTVTFKYSTNYGAKNATVTVTPTYDAEAAQTITVKAKTVDPETWTEDFAGDALPTGWEAGSNWSFADGVAKAAYAYNSTSYLTTPKLEVSDAADELTFDYKATANYVSVKIQMSKDGAAFADYQTISGLNNGDAGTYTITGLEAGTYQFRFANDDYQLDNFEGFKLKAAAAHEAEIADGGLTIPATGSQYVDYTASVTVKVTGASDEELTVRFFIGDTQYGDAVVKTVAANTTETFEVTFAPAEAVSGEAYFTVESAGISAFESNKVAVEIAPATVLDETVGLPDALTTGTKASVVFNYTAKSGWNTIAVPFVLTADMMNQIFGEGWKAYEFKRYDATSKTLGFDATTTFYAGYPYIVYVPEAATHEDGVILKNLNISTTNENYDQHTAVFQASYAPIAAGSVSETWYGVTGEGRIQKAGEKASMKGFRAYFTNVPDGANARLSFYDHSTGITTVISGDEQNGTDRVFNLAGQRLTQPKKGSVNIVNGKKVFIK